MQALRRGFGLALVLLVVFTLYTWLVVSWGPLISLDDRLNQNFHVHSLWPVLHVFDRVGQRVLCIRPLIVIVLAVGWWFRTWRPAVLSAIGVFAINLLVLIIKTALSRGHPITGISFFGDGDLYPSGHTSNVVVVYGLCYYLLVRYVPITRRVRRVLLGLLCLVTVVQFTTSILLRWHWFSDLIGGCLVGGIVLALIAGIDDAYPDKKRAPTRSERLDVANGADVVAFPPPAAVSAQSGTRSARSAPPRNSASMPEIDVSR